MILTCPDCATSYFVDDGAIPDGGRTVKCASCGARWKATPQPQAAAPAEAPPPPADDLVAEPVAAVAPEAEIPPPDDLDIIAEPASPPAPAPAAARAQTKGRGKALWIGAGIAATLALAIGGAVVFRQQVVNAFPASAAAYAAVGLPVDRLGLVIEQVRYQASFQGGRPVLSVTGAIRNTRERTAQAPPLRISLLDKAGKPLFAKLARPLNAEIPGGARRYFAVALADPPAGLQALEVVFEAAGSDDGHAPAKAAHGDAHAEAVLGAEPVGATPLPADSPHALPDQHG
jgi:predicted Zn finger-like uncharacterized protein